MKVYALQLDIVWQDREANYQKVRELIRATDIMADSLIVLPEMFDLGFSMDTSITAQGESLPSDSFVKELAAETGACVLAGIVSDMQEGQPANEAIAISPAGDELVRYRKMHPFTLSGEETKYATGKEHQIFKWADISIAPFSCYDIRFPEIFRPAAQEGAEFIVVIANWPEKRSEHWVRLLQARAIENQAYVLGVIRH